MSKSSHTDEGGPRERRVTLSATGPVAARVATRSGDITVSATSGTEVVVTLRIDHGAPESLLKDTQVEFDESHQTLRVTTPAASGTGGFPLRALKHGLFSTGTRDVDVSLSLPEGSDVEADTTSGDCVIRGVVRDVTLHTVSGDAVVDDAAEVDSHTASGDLVVGRVRAAFKARSASGDVVVREGASQTKVESASGDVRLSVPGGSTEVSTASGDVQVNAAGAGTVVARSASGDVRVAVTPGLEIDVEARSVSGDLTSAFDLDRDGDGGSGD
ncbi:MAG TPA: DUF4097 family beta strand repeat-containing protein, partial [Acidimicrobiales bacterium]|nr:DUF4097 family beta strand repeat-containing protein [Acidimicrobiales bacterium]